MRERLPLYLFQEENCSVLLTFPSHNDTIYRSYMINTAKTYGNGGELVVSDFENGFGQILLFQSTCLKKIETGKRINLRYLVQEGT